MNDSYHSNFRLSEYMHDIHAIQVLKERQVERELVVKSTNYGCSNRCSRIIQNSSSLRTKTLPDTGNESDENTHLRLHENNRHVKLYEKGVEKLRGERRAQETRRKCLENREIALRFPTDRQLSSYNSTVEKMRAERESSNCEKRKTQRKERNAANTFAIIQSCVDAHEVTAIHHSSDMDQYKKAIKSAFDGVMLKLSKDTVSVLTDDDYGLGRDELKNNLAEYIFGETQALIGNRFDCIFEETKTFRSEHSDATRIGMSMTETGVEMTLQ